MRAKGRKLSVRYWASRDGCCCWIGGTRELLAQDSDDAPTGPTSLAAIERFRSLPAMEAHKGTERP